MMPTPEELARAHRITSGQVSVSEILAYLASDHYLTLSSAARYIDHDERIVKTAIFAGKLRAYRIGRKLLIKKSELVAWVQQGEIRPKNPAQTRNDLQAITDKALEQARANVAARRRAR